MNIGELIMYLLLNSEKTNQEIADIVQAKFNSNTKIASVAWYATKLRKEGKLEKKRGQKYKAEFSQEELDEMTK